MKFKIWWKPAPPILHPSRASSTPYVALCLPRNAPPCLHATLLQPLHLPEHFLSPLVAYLDAASVGQLRPPCKCCLLSGCTNVLYGFFAIESVAILSILADLQVWIAFSVFAWVTLHLTFFGLCLNAVSEGESLKGKSNGYPSQCRFVFKTNPI